MYKCFLSAIFFIQFFLQSVVVEAQTQFKLKDFPPEVFQAGSTSLVTARHALPSTELALIVNTQDPQSVQVADYYKQVRNIPEQNVINVSFAPGNINMPREEFILLRADVMSRAPSNVQAFALTWTTPWKVDCMSITSAFAFGFDTAYCQPANAQECYPTKFSNYYNSASKQPRADLQIIPSMMIAGIDFNNAKAVIDRGIASDYSFPRGDGYMIATTDQTRSTRIFNFSYAATIWDDPVNSLKITFIDNTYGFGVDNFLTNVDNILFYFTGYYTIPGLETLQFKPGAVADHLTSFGGALTNSYDQMSILRWLEAGATGSYGTVVEPCNYAAKYTDPGTLYYYYFAGQSLIESYWKSVALPGEGIFVGEPLAKPWGTRVSSLATGDVQIYTTSMQAGKAYYLLTQSTTDNTLYDVKQSFLPDKSKFQTVQFSPSASQYFFLSEDELEALNQPPVLNTIGNRTVNENVSLSFTISASDPDGNPLTYSASNLPSGATFTASTRRFTWRPSYSQAGTYNVQFSVSDGLLNDSETISIVVNNVNRAPTLSTIGNKTVAEDNTLTFTVAGSDADGNALTYSASGLPAGSSFNASTRTFTWRPSFSQAGTYSNVRFTVSDGSLSASQTISITVTNTNRAPELVSIGDKNVSENNLLQFTLAASDLDNDSLTFSATNLPSGASINGSVFSWTPSYSQAGNYSINFSVTDGNLTDSETITVSVSNANRAPILEAIGDSSVAENSLLEFNVTASDADGDNVVVTVADLPSGASFDGSRFSWTPDYSQSGTYNVEFTATDGSLIDSEVIQIIVVNTNRAPVLTSIGDKTLLVGGLLEFVVSAIDPDIADVLTYSVTTLPTGASIDAQSGLFRWTPDAAGAQQIEFVVSDGDLTATEMITVNVGVVNGNNPPVLNPIGSKSVAENSLLEFVVTASDVDGDAVVISASDLPEGASFDGTVFSWIPSYAESGSYDVNFSVTDGTLVDSEVVAITVNNVNRGPVLTSVGNKNVAENQLLQFTVEASDPDNDSLVISANNLPAGASFNGNAFSWMPNYSQAGSYNIEFSVTDGDLTAAETIIIVVANTNRDPVLDSIGNKNIAENGLLQFAVTASDPDNDSIVISATSLPPGASFNGSVFSWTPSYSQAGTYNIGFSVSDGTLVDSESVTIVVSNTNRAPELNAIGNKNIVENNLLEFEVSATDADEDSLVISANNLPVGASFNGTVFSWTPSYSQAGTYDIVFSVTDGNLTKTETITITVSNANRPPLLNQISNKNILETDLLEFVTSANDPDGDNLTFSASELPSGATYNTASGVFAWRPELKQNGSYQIRFSVTDGTDSISQDVTIVVSKLEMAPVLAAIGNKSVVRGVNLLFTVSATDANGDALIFSAQNLPAGASFNVATKQFSFTPSATQSGTLGPIKFTVSDGVLEDFEEITITVLQNKAVALDYNGDRKSDLAYYRPGSLIFSYYTGSSTQNLASFGRSNAKPIQGDFDGDGIVDRTVSFDQGRNTNIRWQIKQSSNGALLQKTWGYYGDLTLSGDLNGNGKDELVVFRKGTWYVENENQTTTAYSFGQNGDLPELRDFDGDNIDDLALFRPSNGQWYILLSKPDASGNKTMMVKQWGMNGDIPMPADFDGDGISEIAIWRPSNATWHVYNLQAGSATSTQWGMKSDVPVVGDFNGDGNLDFSIYRPSNKTWYHNYRNGVSGSKVFGNTSILIPQD